MAKEIQVRKRINAVAVVDNVDRKLISFMEMADGTAQILLFAGRSPGIDATEEKIKSNKYSVHLTPKSELFTMIKRTTVLELGGQPSVVQMTSAVKSKSGFAPIVQLTFMDLTSAIHDIDERTDGEVVRLMKYDPHRQTISLGIYVGALESKFDLDGIEKNFFGIHRFVTENFQFIVLATFFPMPSMAVSTFHEYVTEKCEVNDDGLDIVGRTKGLSPRNCAREFLILSRIHMTSLVDFFKYEMKDDQAGLDPILNYIKTIKFLDVDQMFPPDDDSGYLDGLPASNYSSSLQ